MKAIAYVAKTNTKNNEKSVSPSDQKNKIKEYARIMGIDVIAFYEDVDNSKDALKRALISKDDFDVVLVDKVNSFGKTFAEIKPVMNELDKAGKAMIAANYYWDVLSQKVRRHYKAIEMKMMTNAHAVKATHADAVLV
jgi:DNA invertase Pin-like site-specific DNA recombinase